MKNKFQNISRASTQLFLYLETRFHLNQITLMQKGKFLIFTAQLFSLVITNTQKKELLFQQSIYLENMINLIAFYPILQDANYLTSNIFIYLIAVVLCIIFALIANVIYSNYQNFKRDQTVQIFFLSETIRSKHFLSILFSFWKYVLLIPFMAISVHSYIEDLEANDVFGFGHFIIILNLVFSTLLTLYISYFLRQHQFKESIQLEEYSFINIINALLIEALVFRSFYGEEDQFQLGLHIILISILLLHIYQGLFLFSYGFSQLQNLNIKIYTNCLAFEIYYLFWNYTNMTDELLFFFCFIIIPFIINICELLYTNYCYQELNNIILHIGDSRHINSALRFIYETYQLNSQKSSNYKQREILMHSLFYQHCLICQNRKCPIRQNRTLSDYKNQNKNSQQIIETFIQNFYQEILTNVSFLKNDIIHYESIAINYFTFLIMRNNYLLAYKCCQESQNLIQINQQQRFQSFYFKHALSIISDHCILKIYEKNRKLVTISSQQSLIQSDIINLLQVEDYYLNQLYSQLILYIKLFTDYLQQKLYSFQELFEQLEILYSKNDEIRKIIYKQNLDHRDLKSASLYHLRIEFIINIVTNDNFVYLLESAQKLNTIEEQLLNDNTKTFFNNNSFLDDQGISIIGNLLNGQLQNSSNKSISRFFNYNSLIQLTKSEQLMPRELGVIHQGLIDRYLITGLSTRINNLSETYISNAEGYLERCQIFFSNYFSQSNKSDLLLIVFLKKIPEISQNSGTLLVTENQDIFGISEELFYYIYGEESQAVSPSYKDPQSKNQCLRDLYSQKLADISQSCSEYINKNQSELKNSVHLKYTGSIIKYSSSPIGKSLRLINSISSKQSQIQFYVVRKVFYPYIGGEETPTVFYEIHIEFEMYDNKFTTLQKIQLNKRRILALQYQKSQINYEKDQQLTGRIISEDNVTNRMHKVNYNLDQSSVSNLQELSDSNIIGQVQKLNYILNSKKFSKSINYFTAKVILKCIFICTFTILFSLLNVEKNKGETMCIFDSNFDIEYLDGYSQLFFGGRRIMYYRDFYNNSQDRIIDYNQTNINISRYDQIVYSHLNLHLALKKLKEKEKDFKQMLAKEEYKTMEISLLDHQYQVYYQQVNSRAEFNEVMYITFFWSYLTFAKTPAVFLSGQTDAFIIIFTRSQLMYNFFSMAELTSIQVSQCYDTTKQLNQYIDNLAMVAVISYYLILVFITVIGPIFLVQAFKQSKIYFKYFGLLTQQDLISSIDYYQSLKELIKVPQLCFSTFEFSQLVEKPTNQLKDIKAANIDKKQTQKLQINQIRKTLSYKKYIAILSIGFIATQIYGIFNQIYYQFQSNQITPLFQKSMEAQQIRLNFIRAMSYWDVYCVRKYYLAYNATKTSDSFWTQNIQQNLEFIQYLNVSLSKVNEEIDNLNSMKISDLIIGLENSDHYNYDEMNKFGYQDLCKYTGCDLQSLEDRPHFHNFIEYFKQGVIQLENIVSKIFEDHRLLLKEDISDQEFLINYQKLQEDLDYFLIYQFGVDAFQLEMQQISVYLLQLSKIKLNDSKLLDLIIIILIGIIILLLYIIASYYLISQLKHLLIISKSSMKYIPISVLFSKKIDHQILILEKRSL